MTAPLTRSITLAMWVIIAALIALVIALPFVKSEGMLGRMAYYAIILACLSFCTTCLLGLVHRIAEMRSPERRNEQDASE